MLSLSTAQKLKAAGLTWAPALHDFFAVPERGMDDRVFVISDMSVDIGPLYGRSVVTIIGTGEWALDYEVISDLVWMPTEAQLRQALEQHLLAEPQPALKLFGARDHYLCQIQFRDQSLTFEAPEAGEAYAAALLHVIKAVPAVSPSRAAFGLGPEPTATVRIGKRGLMNGITISAGSIVLTAELNDTPTAQQVWDALPIEGTATRWGDEIYFEIPVIAGQETNARAQVEVGELGYWPEGKAFCIFFGPTPSSTDQRPRAYSPVNILGRVSGDATLLRRVADGAPIRIARRERDR